MEGRRRKKGKGSGKERGQSEKRRTTIVLGDVVRYPKANLQTLPASRPASNFAPGKGSERGQSERGQSEKRRTAIVLGDAVRYPKANLQTLPASRPASNFAPSSLALPAPNPPRRPVRSAGASLTRRAWLTFAQRA